MGLPRTTCPQCGKEMTKKALQRHTKEQNSNDSAFPVFICDICNLATKRKVDLVDHMKRKHLQPKKLGRLKRATSESPESPDQNTAKTASIKIKCRNVRNRIR